MDEISLKHFRKLCGMLGSDQPGERAAAAQKATEFLRAQQRTWQDVGMGDGVIDAATLVAMQQQWAADKQRIHALEANMRALQAHLKILEVAVPERSRADPRAHVQAELADRAEVLQAENRRLCEQLSAKMADANRLREINSSLMTRADRVRDLAKSLEEKEQQLEVLARQLAEARDRKKAPKGWREKLKEELGLS